MREEGEGGLENAAECHDYFIHDPLRFSSESIEPIGPLSYVIQVLKTDDWVV